jgi:CHAT domain
MKYLNLDLEVFDYKNENDIESFRVRVASSPVGEQRLQAADTVTLSDTLRSRLKQLERRSFKLQQMIALGEDLAAALFPTTVRSLLAKSKARLRDDEGLRVRLKLDTYALGDLPWEYCYVAEPNTPDAQKDVSGFLVIDRRLSLVRYQVLGDPLTPIGPVGLAPLRLVVLLSNPQNTPGLNLETEQKNIEQALREQSAIKPEFFPNATVDILEEAMNKGAHIFHYSGHGKFEGDMGQAYGTQEGKGYLALTGDDGKEIGFSAEKLAVSLGKKGVRFTMLSACESGRVDQVNAWTGIASALTRAGIPAVVGMQYTIKDVNAIAFTKSLYLALAAGQTIDEAVIAGRQAIFIRSTEEERDWGVPVLYLRAEEGILFPQPPITSSPQTPEERTYLQKRFETILAQIDLVTDYKVLHDGLHEIQYTFYPTMFDNTKIVLDDKYAKKSLSGLLNGYRREVSNMKDAARRGKVDAEENQWIDQLDIAASVMEQGIRKGNRSEIDAAGQSINDVRGAQPSIINRKLYNAVSTYNQNLSELPEVMTKVLKQLSTDQAEAEKFERGITALKQLNGTLHDLISEHNVWQDIDGLLQMLPDLLVAAGAQVFEKRWLPLRKRIEPYYTSQEDESSVLFQTSKRLKEADGELTAAVATGDAGEVGSAFRDYYDSASERFYYVDKSVKELCEKLTSIRDELG